MLIRIMNSKICQTAKPRILLYKKLRYLAHVEKTEEQLLFTFFDDKGNINQRLHTDYLNYRMKSIERRHKHLTHAPPHKLRHTGATLAKQAGVALEQISEALTHSDTNITRTYVNTPNVIQMPIGEIAYRKLSQKESDRNGVNSKKDASQSELRNA